MLHFNFCFFFFYHLFLRNPVYNAESHLYMYITKNGAGASLFDDYDAEQSCRVMRREMERFVQILLKIQRRGKGNEGFRKRVKKKNPPTNILNEQYRSPPTSTRIQVNSIFHWA